MSSPKVFISYSWDSDSHKQWVRRLAERLVHAGVDVTLDQWQIVPGESLTAFMEGGVRDAEFVIVICTPAFAYKADSRTGGVGYEQQIVSGDLLQGTPRSKFIPLLRSGEFVGESRAIPTYLSGSVVIDCRSDSNFDTFFEDVLRAIFKKQRFIKPDLGTPPPLLPVVNADAQSTSANEVYAERYLIDLDNQFNPTEGPNALAVLVGEIQDSIRRKVPFEVEVNISRLQETRKELAALAAAGNLTLKERERRLELRQIIQGLSVFEISADEFLAEMIGTAVRQLWHTTKITEAEEVADSISNALSLFSGRGWPTGTKFDVFPQDSSWYTSFRIERQMAEELAEREGVPLGFLTGGYGLRLSDFSSTVIRTRVIPALIFEYFRLRHREADNLPPVEDFFRIYGLRVGLG